MYIKHFFIAALFFCLFKISYSQNYLPLNEIGLKEGLSQGMIFDILQTADGFMWFATKDGLNRYDGKNFVVYRNNPQDSFSVSNNMILKLFEDKYQNFWIRTKTGLDIFDAKTGRFRHVLNASNRSKKFNNSLKADIEQDKNGTLYFTSTEQGIHSLAITKNLADFLPNFANLQGKLPFILYPLSDIDENLHDIFISSKAEILIATAKDVYLLLPQQKKMQPLQVPTIFNPNETRTNLILENTDGKLIFVRTGHQIVWDRQSFSPILNCNSLENAYMYYKNQEIWIGNVEDSKAMIARLPSIDFSAENYQKRTSYQFSNLALPTKLYCDKMGSVWIGTNGYGIRKYNPLREVFRHYAAGKSIGQVQKNQDGLYIQIVRAFFKLPPGENLSALKKLTPNMDFGLLLDINGKNWILTNIDGDPLGKNNALIQTDKNWNYEKEYPINYEFNNTTMLCVDKQNNIWFNPLASMMCYFDTKTSEIRTLDYSHFFKDATVSTTFNYFDNQNTLWLGTEQGLLSAKKNGQNFDLALFKNISSQPNTLPYNHIAAICDDPKDPDHYLWIGTKGGGLIRMDKKNLTFKSYTEKNGLPNNTVYGIITDSQDNLWLSTNRGIVKFNPATEFCRIYTKEDGLQDDEFNTQSFFKSQTGEICFGGINGVNIFNPAELGENKTPPKVVLIDLKVNNQIITSGDSTGILPFSLQTEQTLVFNHLQNNITLSFAALDYTYTNQNQYHYKYILEGADREIVYAGSQDIANYTALAPGFYTFKVWARNPDGFWSSEPALIYLNIKPPIWRTVWAYILYCVLLVIILYQLYQAQIRRVNLANRLSFEQKEAERLVALDQLKMRFFSNVTHEFRTPLTLIIEPARQLVKNLQEKSYQQEAIIIHNNSQRLLQLVNQLLDLAKLESGSMKVLEDVGEILPLIESIYLSFKNLALKQNINFKWTHPPYIPPFAFDKDKIEKILNNLLSNAFKFTPPKGSIHLITQLHENQIIITIQDTGIGMTDESLQKLFTRFYQADNSTTRKGEGTGIGLSLVKEFVSLMKGKIEVKSESEKGSTFIVSIPAKIATVEEETLVEEEWQEHVSITDTLDKSSFNIEENNLILWVEDNEDMRIFVEKLLVAQGWQLITAKNGAEGIEKAVEFVPNLIISDVMMPEKDGYELTETLKNDIRTSHIPIILLTAKNSMDSRLAGLTIGADEYIGKPFNSEELILRAKGLLALYERIAFKLNVQHENPISPTEKEENKEIEVQISTLDFAFLEAIEAFIEKNIDNSALEVQHFLDNFYLSRAQLHRKMIALTKQSITEFVRNFRLAKAQTLLAQKKYSINEIADMTGFGTAKYFATAYKKRYGVSPSEV